MNFEGEREQWGGHRRRIQGVMRVLLCVATMMIMDLNNCFSNYRCCETTVKASVCSSLLGENRVIECGAREINDLVFATWQLVLIIIGNGGLLHIVSNHWYDLIKWFQFSHFTIQSLKKNGLICISFSSDPVGKSCSKENYIERRGCPRGAIPINIVIFGVWIVLNLWWPQTSQNLLSVRFFLSSGDCLTYWFSPLQSFCQHFISSCSMHWYFKDSFSPSRWAAVVFRHFLLTRLLKSEVFVVWCRVPLINLPSRSKMILKWQNELLLLHLQRLDEVLFCIHLGAITASYKSFECRLIEAVFMF